jgi:hypothetical protein
MNRKVGVGVPEELWTESERWPRRRFRSQTLYGDSPRDIEEQAFLQATDPDVFGPGARLKLIELVVTPLPLDVQERSGVHKPYAGTVNVGLVED